MWPSKDKNIDPLEKMKIAPKCACDTRSLSLLALSEKEIYGAEMKQIRSRDNDNEMRQLILIHKDYRSRIASEEHCALTIASRGVYNFIRTTAAFPRKFHGGCTPASTETWSQNKGLWLCFASKKYQMPSLINRHGIPLYLTRDVPTFYGNDRRLSSYATEFSQHKGNEQSQNQGLTFHVIKLFTN